MRLGRQGEAGEGGGELLHELEEQIDVAVVLGGGLLGHPASVLDGGDGGLEHEQRARDAAIRLREIVRVRSCG